MIKRLSASDETAAYCTKCRLDLNHVIVAMVGQKIARVKCKTCGSEHQFRSEGGDREGQREKTRLPKEKSRKVVTSEVLWEKSVAGAKGKELPYNMSNSYTAGDIIVHSLFGRGVVQKTHFKKCSVIFRDKERMLASANTQ